jgi:PAS domain-containing protein
MKSILPSIDDFVKKAKSIHESTKEWENLFHSIPDMITIHDKEFNILFANKAAEKLLDLPPNYDITKIKCFKYYHGTACPPAGCPSCECLKTGTPAIFEMFEPHLNMFVEIRAIPRLDYKNKIIGIIHIARDITHRKHMEEKLRNSRKQLRGCVSNMISIREKERAKISREIHDELSQSLTTLKMNLFLLEKKIPKNRITIHEIIKSMFKVIDSSLKEIKRIASDLRPKILDELGILEAVKWQARKFQEQTGIACEIDKKQKPANWIKIFL